MPSWRIIPGLFPPVRIFDRVADPRNQEAILELDAWVDPRLRDEVGDIRRVPAADRVSGPGPGVIMAAVTHMNPKGLLYVITQGKSPYPFHGSQGSPA